MTGGIDGVFGFTVAFDCGHNHSIGQLAVHAEVCQRTDPLQTVSFASGTL
jgi:hypothetical protein